MSGTGSLSRLKAKVTATLRGRGRAKDRGGPSGDSTNGSSRPGSNQGRPGSDRAADGRGGRSNDDHSGTGGIAVAYSPERDGDADPGEVVWTWVPYEDDPSQGKDRPVLILGRDGAELAGVQLSSKDHSDRRDAGEWVPVGTGGWDREARPSYADASRLLRIDPGAVRREGSALDEARFREVLARVTALHDWRA